MRNTVRTIFWIAIIVISNGGLVLGADLPPELIRPFAPAGQRKAIYPIRAIPGTVAEHLDAFVYTDVSLPKESSESTLGERLMQMERQIYPDLLKLIPGLPNKVSLIFDDLKNHDHPAFYNAETSKRYGQELVFLDVRHANAFDLKYLLVHELQHVARAQVNPHEAAWLNEGLSKFMEYYYFKTFPLTQLEQLRRNSQLRLDYDFKEARPAHYFDAFFFVYYLYRHFGGIELIQELMKSSRSGIESIDHALKNRVEVEKDSFKRNFYSFRQAFLNYQLALLANRYADTIDSAGLLELGLGEDSPKALREFAVDTEFVESSAHLYIEGLSARYLQLSSKCFTISSEVQSFRFIVLDVNHPDPSLRIQTIVPEVKNCFHSEHNSGQFLVAVYLNEERSSFWIRF